MSQFVASAIHCINPDCPRPFPQPWGNRFCNSCGATLLLNQRYVPLAHLGTGGFAAIYTVWDNAAQVERVLKVLLETSPKALELFEQEAAVLASLRHPGIPRVESESFFQLKLDQSSMDQLSCLVMEKINGQTLQNILDQYPQGCAEDLVQDWLNQAVEILRELHDHQIIHRDLKPSNLMLRQGTGQLVAIDFGGAKQIGTIQLGSEMSSTRLISPGYSPPEQISGGAVGPAADFYALGRTMIQLLTGQPPSVLQDPETGELRWRHCAPVSSHFADLLDDMVRVDVRQRPATAAEIQSRLSRMSSTRTKLSKAPVTFSQLVTTVLRKSLKLSWLALKAVGKALIQTVSFVVWTLTKVVQACLDTTWEMLLGGLGAGIFAAAGFGLAYWSPLGPRVTNFLKLYWPSSVLSSHIQTGGTLLLFTTAGLGTAYGLTLAGGFGQRKRPLVAALIGALSYGLGWFVWQAMLPENSVEGLLLWTALAIGPLTLGLGLSSHQIVHALVTATGTATFNFLISQLPSQQFALSIFDESRLPESLFFFSLQGVIVAFWLGLSYYILVPCLRWLGWR